MKTNKSKFLFRYFISSLILLSGCAKIETTPLEERLPLFDWNANFCHTIFEVENTTDLTDILKDYYSYTRHSNYYNCLFEFTADNVKFYELIYGFENDTILIDAGTWNVQSNRLSFNENFRNSFNEFFGFPMETDYYETVSYMGKLHLGTKYYDSESEAQNYKYLELIVRY